MPENKYILLWSTESDEAYLIGPFPDETQLEVFILGLVWGDPANHLTPIGRFPDVTRAEEALLAWAQEKGADLSCGPNQPMAVGHLDYESVRPSEISATLEPDSKWLK